jgi:hypothetical protein
VVTFELDVTVENAEGTEALERIISTKLTLGTFVDIILGLWDEALFEEEELGEEEETTPEWDRASLRAAFDAMGDKAMRGEKRKREEDEEESEVEEEKAVREIFS